MNAFLSHSLADKKLAERLREDLERQGVEVRSAPEQGPGFDRARRIEEAVRAADDILVLIGRGESDNWQRLEWQAALEAVWKDPRKRLISVLLGDTPLPAFARSAGGASWVVRVGDPRDLASVTRAILHAFEDQRRGKTRSAMRGDATLEDDRAERTARLDEIREYAEHLKYSAKH